MFKGRSKGRIRGRGGQGPVQKVPLKGLFTDGVWHCNCEPRLPAQRFQTKNGGKNHGRWFYTCQKPQPTRCGFFLWDEEAKPREAAVLLNNSRSEPPSTETPSKPIASTGYLTPQTGTRPRQQSLEFRTPDTPSKSSRLARAQRLVSPSNADSSTQGDSEEEFYDWPLTDDEELSKVADHASSQAAMRPPETPCKAVKTDIRSTPGKRKYEDLDTGDSAAWPTPIPAKKEDDVFATPATNGKNLFSMTTPLDTPTPLRFKDVTSLNGGNSSLATEILDALQSASLSLPDSVRDKVRDICDRQSLYTHGIIRGRDVSRSLIAKKDAKIVELQGSIEALQAERETSRAVIRHLRKEIGTRKTNGQVTTKDLEAYSRTPYFESKA